jgi:transitional endoplasmic reticulum ATPase
MPILQPKQIFEGLEVQYLIKENRYCETYRVEDEDQKSFFLKLFIKRRMPERLVKDDGTIPSVALSMGLYADAILSVAVSSFVEIDGVGECHYILTEYFAGELLEDRLNREGALSLGEAVRIYKAILHGLVYLHVHYPPLAHNDITPRNILLTNDGDLKIIDMGHLSYVKNSSDRPPLDNNDLDVRYLAGEVALNIFNEKTDLFSATAVFYHMLFGEAPWIPTEPLAPAFPDRMRAMLIQRSRGGKLDLDRVPMPKELRAILRKGLEIRIRERYDSVQQILADLDKIDLDVLLNEFSQGQEMAEREKRPRGFEAIAGMNDLKKMLSDRVLFLMKNKDKVEEYKLIPPNGMLLYGPPGCGKTFFAEKFAEECGYNFIMVKMSNIGSTLVHGTEENISKLFEEAEAKAPTILCFDEFDAFVPARTTYEGRNQAGEVNEFLSHLNNCGERGVFVIATSNRPDMIDPAVLRTGRIDKQIFVPLPDEEARAEMFDMYLKDRPCDSIDTNVLAGMTEGYIASDISYICNETAMIAALNDKHITQEMLGTTIRSIRPSIRPDVIKMYDDIRDKMEGIVRKNTINKIGF